MAESFMIRYQGISAEVIHFALVAAAFSLWPVFGQ
jgi:hypothetical protein